MCRSGAESRAGSMSKRLNEDEVEKRTAYEVSVSKIEYME